jgi:hypothetical protein
VSLHVYLLCHNEEVLLPHAVEHYRRRVPDVTFTILDNESNDRSVAIANELGCTVQSFTTGDALNDDVLRDLKNSVWLERTEGWVIVADMDEWLCVTADDLAREERAGTTVLKVEGWNVVGESAMEQLNDIDLHALNTGAIHTYESKSICFRRPQITAMNYNTGAHRSRPEGIVRRSRKTYRLKHMNWLGSAFVVHKYATRYARGKEQQARGLGIQYTDQTDKVINEFNEWRAKARTFSEQPFWARPTWPPAAVPMLRRRAARVARRLRGLVGPSHKMSS